MTRIRSPEIVIPRSAGIVENLSDQLTERQLFGGVDGANKKEHILAKRMDSIVNLQEPKRAGSEVDDSDHVEDIKSSDMSEFSMKKEEEILVGELNSSLVLE